LSEGLGDLLAKIMFEPIPVPSTIVPSLPHEFDGWWAQASSRDMEYRFQSAKELADSLAIALDVSVPATVAAAPPGLREASLHDYSLAVADGAMPQESQSSVGSLWPLTQTGKLLAAGVAGVIVIATSISLQNIHDSKKVGQTLVTPSASLASSTASPEPAPSAPAVNPKGEPAVETATPQGTKAGSISPAAGATASTPVESLQKSVDKNDPSRREKSGPRSVPKSDNKQNRTPSSSPPPAKAKGTDFGI
jgi:serine/threonine-protein kinase